jgi:5-methylcytosine-specific restriction endonuclease McrA
MVSERPKHGKPMTIRKANFWCVVLVLTAVLIAYVAQRCVESIKEHHKPSPIVNKVSSKFRYHGQALLPDPQLTPGRVREDATLDSVCHSHTSEYRNTTASMKREAYSLYGVEPHTGVCSDVVRKTKRGSEVTESCEVDHLISLELGGADDVANLWPEPYNPPDDAPGAHAKDKVENWLHRQVCSGNMELKTAQDAIAKDWYQVYLDNHLEGK